MLKTSVLESANLGSVDQIDTLLSSKPDAGLGKNKSIFAMGVSKARPTENDWFSMTHRAGSDFARTIDHITCPYSKYT